MNTLQKAVSGVLLIGVITVLTLPDRKAVELGKTLFEGTRGILSTAMGTGKTV